MPRINNEPKPNKRPKKFKVFVADGVELADHIVKEFQFVSGRIAVFSVDKAVVLGN